MEHLTNNAIHAPASRRGTTAIQVCILSLDCFPLFDDASLHESIAGRVGGAELQMYYLARELAKDDQFDIHVIVDDFGQEPLELHEGVHLHKCAFRLSAIDAPEPLPGVNKRLRLLRCLHQLNPDVCVHRSISLQTFLISVYCRASNTSFLYMMSHDGGAIPELDPDRNKSGWFLNRRLYEYGMTRADRIVVQNDEQKRALQQNYGRSSWSRPSAHPIPDQKQSEDQLEYVSWIARSEKRKQPGFFLDLAEQFPRTSFLMIMPDAGDTTFRQRIKNKALQTNNITFLDYVPHRQIDKYFRKSRVFVNTSKSEGFPNTFIEAARTSTPILSYSINPNRILNTHQMGICAEADQSKMENALHFLLNNDSERSRMARNARSYAKEHHDLDKIIRKDKSILRTMANEHRTQTQNSREK